MGALTELQKEHEQKSEQGGILGAMEALEKMKDLCGFYAKMKTLEAHGMTTADGFFYEIFTEEEQQLLFELEDRGYLTTGIVRLLG